MSGLGRLGAFRVLGFRVWRLWIQGLGVMDSGLGLWGFRALGFRGLWAWWDSGLLGLWGRTCHMSK